ncbi:MAG: hypothetical protein HYT76_05515 [Deltaproteobacteria bacterium]|nr:hypothetical protein [Deltaproteobacteria bacterium]
MGTLKKIIRTGLGAALMTEEGVRTALTNQAKQRKADLENIIAREVGKFLQRINIHQEIRKALEGLTIEVKIKGSRN